jgi:hypothetical protein
VLSQLTSKYLHLKTCKSIPKLARAKRVKMADILSKINSKDTFEILGWSAPKVFENKEHTQYKKKKSASAKKGISIYFFFFFLRDIPTHLQNIFQRISCF